MQTKTALVTGASSGFGKLTVELLLKEGLSVIAALRGGDQRLQEVFGHDDSLRRAIEKGRLLAVDLHLDRSVTFQSAVDLIQSRFSGHLDVLINNAGYGLLGPMEDISESQLRKQMETNFFGTILLTQQLLPFLRNARGRIITMSSIAGRFALPYYGPYNASKFALEGAFEALAHELHPDGIQIALVEPGGFKTDFMSRSTQYAERSLNPASRYHAPLSRFRRRMQRRSELISGDPTSVARLVVRLCKKRRIRIRYVIGKDALLMSYLARLLPDQIRFSGVGAVFRILF